MKAVKLIPSLKNYIWGGTKLFQKYGLGSPDTSIAECWSLSAHPDGESILEDGRAFSEYIKESPDRLGIDRLSDEFPILIKFIDADKDLSVQVHPDNETAKRMEGGIGKTETWYVIENDKNAKIVCGIKKGKSR